MLNVSSFSPRITEENFWRNYFYRVALICQAGDLGTLGDANEFGKNEGES
jgi:hypothetical protein